MREHFETQDLSYLKRLFDLCRASGVIDYNAGGISIKFHVEQSQEAPGVATETMAKALKDHEMSLPPDLRADDSLNYDKIMNWSGSPDHDDRELPLAEDKPLV